MPDTMAGVTAEFGAALRGERERRGVSLERLCAETKVSSRHLQALEEGDFKALPGGVFRRGIVRAYLRVMGLEEADWMPRFQVIHAEFLRAAGQTAGAADDWVKFALNVKKGRGGSRERTALRWLGVLVLLLALVAGGWAVFHYLLAGRLGS